jgi:hypothetical protein
LVVANILNGFSSELPKVCFWHTIFSERAVQNGHWGVDDFIEGFSGGAGASPLHPKLCPH